MDGTDAEVCRDKHQKSDFRQKKWLRLSLSTMEYATHPATLDNQTLMICAPNFSMKKQETAE